MGYYQMSCVHTRQHQTNEKFTDFRNNGCFGDILQAFWKRNVYYILNRFYLFKSYLGVIDKIKKNAAIAEYQTLLHID